jgi:hypothetical protein
MHILIIPCLAQCYVTPSVPTEHLEYEVTIYRSTIVYDFIVYFLNIIEVYILVYEIGQRYTTLTFE